MGHWANYVGSLDMPKIEFAEEEQIYNVMDGKKWAVSNMDIAQKNVEYYARQGKVCTIETKMETYGYERVIHGPSGQEYNA